ncbi:unnamed protein product, partial [Allacma fusca]
YSNVALRTLPPSHVMLFTHILINISENFPTHWDTQHQHRKADNRRAGLTVRRPAVGLISTVI